MLSFPVIDPVAFSILGLDVRWYALAYLCGLLGGWQYCMFLARRYNLAPAPSTGSITASHYDAFLLWAVVGVILGGRIGYVLFYNLDHYIANPWESLQVWHGGMSFHGGMLGVLLAALIFVRRQRISFWQFSDLLACATPIGLFFGRLANFINGELFGRVTDVPWGMVFPRGDMQPRHPSQLYEAGLEGLVLFIIMALLVRISAVRGRAGMLSGIFLISYGTARFAVEFLREPDPQLGFLFAEATMGQMLCVPMLLVGVFAVARALHLGVLAPQGRG